MNWWKKVILNKRQHMNRAFMSIVERLGEFFSTSLIWCQINGTPLCAIYSVTQLATLREFVTFEHTQQVVVSNAQCFQTRFWNGKNLIHPLKMILWNKKKIEASSSTDLIITWLKTGLMLQQYVQLF